jgi:hypothetical protein
LRFISKGDIFILKNKKLDFYSIFFVFTFIAPHILISISPSSITNLIYFVLIIFYFGFALSIKIAEKIRITWGGLLLTGSFIFFGFLSQFFKSSFSFLNLVLPVVAMLGFICLNKREVDLRVFRFTLFALYSYFYFVYFSVIPDLFFRPGFDEDEVVFDISSSNAIPMSLNMILYSFLILSKFYGKNASKEIYFFSIINVLLSVIQQSRVGMLVALLIMLISSFRLNKKLFVIKLFLIFTLSFLFSNFIDFIELVIGNISSPEAIGDDIRGEALYSFFHNMDPLRFIFGYPSNFIFATSPYTELKYTYNVFIDLWSRYGFLQFLVISVIFILRICRMNKYFFPLYYFLPFLIYSLVESFFFPNYWDCIIYLLLFTPKKNVVLFE